MASQRPRWSSRRRDCAALLIGVISLLLVVAVLWQHGAELSGGATPGTAPVSGIVQVEDSLYYDPANPAGRLVRVPLARVWLVGRPLNGRAGPMVRAAVRTNREGWFAVRLPAGRYTAIFKIFGGHWSRHEPRETVVVWPGRPTHIVFTGQA
jgi:hypothetical protein